MRWSYTMLKTYEECPLKYRFKYVDRLPQGEKGAAALRGIAIHKKSEDFINGKARKMPKELVSLEDEFKYMRQEKARAEKVYYFDDEWKTCDKKEAWGIVKIDSLFTFEPKRSVIRLVVVDVKTGRPRDYVDQGRLYVVVGMCADEHEDVDEGTYRFFYVDHGEVLPEKPRVLPRRGLPAVKVEFHRRVDKMWKDKTFRAKPSAESCRWCDWKKSKGGPCKHG